MAIRRKSSTALQRMGAQSSAGASSLRQFGLQGRAVSKENLLNAIRGFIDLKRQHDVKKEQEKAKDRGGGPLGTGVGAGGGAIIGGLLGGPIGVALGVGLGAASGSAVGEAVDPAGSPEAYARGRQLTSAVTSLAPLAGGVAGGFAGVSPHEAGTWGQQFGRGFGRTMSDIQGYAAMNPLVAGPAGIPYNETGYIGSAKYAPPPGFSAGPGMKITGYEMTPPSGTAPPRFPGPQAPAAPADPRLGMYPQWNDYENPFWRG